MTDRNAIQIRKEVRIQVVPRSLLGRILAVALAVLIVAVTFFFFAAGIVLLGLFVAVAIGRVLWVSMQRPHP